jgi:hypothetical protein
MKTEFLNKRAGLSLRLLKQYLFGRVSPKLTIENLFGFPYDGNSNCITLNSFRESLFITSTTNRFGKIWDKIYNNTALRIL